MLTAINLCLLILGFVGACTLDNFVVRMASVTVCTLSAFILGMDFGEQGE